MGVRIDGAWRHDPARGVDSMLGGMCRKIADRGDATASDSDIGPEALTARAVDDRAAADEQIEGLSRRS